MMPRRFRFVLSVLSLAVAVWGAGAARAAAPGGRLLFIHDNAKVAEPLLDYLRAHGGFEITVVDQAHLPADWSGYRAVLGYVHNKLLEPTENSIIGYTRKGGRFVALHHMISSAKAANRHYFDFLGVHMDNPKAARNTVSPGGDYGWYNGGDGEPGVKVTLVNLNPSNYIVSHDVHWDDTVAYQSSDRMNGPRTYPAIVLPKAEAYMNVKNTDGREKTVLCGYKYVDPRTQVVFEQDTIAWYKDAGAGRIYYFQPGHYLDEYRNPNIDQMILNAIVWDGR